MGMSFAALRQRAGLDLADVISEFAALPEVAHSWETGETSPPPQVTQSLKLVGDFRPSVPVSAKPAAFRFIDLFAGIGGLRKPFEEIGGRCVFTAEWDRFARETYAANFADEHGDHEFAGDIRPYAADPARVPSHDVLLAGFPCQPFSIAGVSKKNSLGRPHGFLCDTQGTLFHDLAKIIAHHRPSAFLLENVKNLERHDGGKTFATIRHVLEEELDYKVQYRVISSAPWVPQKRERIFMVGFRDDTDFDFSQLVIPDGQNPVLGDILESDPSRKYTLSWHLWNYLREYKAKHQSAGNGFGYSMFGPTDVSRTLSARYYKDGSECLIAQPGGIPRRLTPRECARLMGFDTSTGSDFRIPVSDTQAYRQFGNAVVVPVVRAVALLMAPHIVSALAAKEGKTATARGG
ncbi:DNA (cytosine-5-)-methyltransferase [Sphingomonas sp. SUN039]|uniref:DNA (cytosine-5-)-methyltransferase n=1 Tax=Sphingomonas sp. SUN039 TaxID=2937787 RepID=UPI0021642B0C|nr:DNA (cytosine-5-)-methyltransferase [Sphingomonas sp. SUN039]UVO55190.1 DNA (cytosine-5-)-methyltransferase [Sphingomonas sp. SUN039]